MTDRFGKQQRPFKPRDDKPRLKLQTTDMGSNSFTVLESSTNSGASPSEGKRPTMSMLIDGYVCLARTGHEFVDFFVC